MPEQNRNAHLDRPLPPPPPTNTHSKSLLASMIRWLQIKKYQYEVTFSLYMLTATEKFVFNVIILAILSLLIAAAIFYLPNHIAIVSNRLWYYVHGEFLDPANGHAAAAGSDAKDEVRRLMTEAVTSAGAGASAVRVPIGEL